MDNRDDSVSRILRVADLTPELAAELDRYRRNITVMFTDIKGSTSYFEKYGDSAGTLMVHRCNGLLGDIATRHSGRVIKNIGDSIMVSFDEPEAAVTAAIEMQRTITAQETKKSESDRISIRIGMNHGPGIVKTNDVFGDVVNTASRVETSAAPEQILVPDNIQRMLAASGRFVFRHLGKFELKGKAETRDLFEVVWNEQGRALPTATHSVLVPDSKTVAARFKLQQVRSDGSAGTEHRFAGDAIVIGRADCDLSFAHDTKLQAKHARVSIAGAQLLVEALGGSAVFFSLVGPYRLRHGDAVRIGQQLLEFHANAAAITNAANSGIRMPDLITILEQPVAEFMSAAEKRSYPIKADEVTWGRTKGTYTFPNDQTMSRSHAKVFHRGEDFFLEDTGSRNGTFVQVREKAQVPPGATIALGGQILKVLQEN